MKWQRLGRIFEQTGKAAWQHSHASLPTPWQWDADRWRVFFASRDAHNRSHIGFFDFNPTKPNDILGSSEQPVLAPGMAGSFDAAGVSPACLLHKDGKLYLYYLGWNLAPDVPFRNSIGLAVWSESTQRFERCYPGPIMDRSPYDPLTLSYPYVMPTPRGYRMWYGSHLSWQRDGFPMQHLIKSAESQDGVDWKRDNQACLPLTETDYAFSRPWLRQQAGQYQMWYCYRGAGYRIGYASSADGQRWTRQDEIGGLLPSGKGWESQEVCYPAAFQWQGETYLLYNGNGYGETGVGLAKWVGSWL
jgi:hypothetical protein